MHEASQPNSNKRGMGNFWTFPPSPGKVRGFMKILVGLIILIGFVNWLIWMET